MTFLISALEVLYYVMISVVVVAYTLGLSLLHKGSPRPRFQRASGVVPTVSLVIPTYNDASIIHQKLGNVLELGYPRAKFEVVVGDSASSADTGRIAQKFAGDHSHAVN